MTAHGGRLEAVFRGTVARLDPAARVAGALSFLGVAPRACVIVAAGKAALAMTRGALAHLDAVSRHRGGQGASATGVVVVPERSNARTGTAMDLPALPGLRFLGASHPVPDARSVAAARAAMAAVVGAPSHAEVLALISGGASALLCLPTAGLELADKVATTSALAASGVDIHALNTVRKHLSAIKGGKLAQASPVPVTTLVASDVIGDDMSAVGSGPTLPDPTSFAQACAIVEEHAGWDAIPPRARAHLERGAAGHDAPAPRPRDRALLVAGLDLLIDAACAEACTLGMDATVIARQVTGHAADLARRVAAHARDLASARPVAPRVLVAGGEPTLSLPATPGRGGRAQHVALLVARDIAGTPGVTVLVAGSDGVDGTGEAAGAIVDGATWHAIHAAGMDPDQALSRCDSHTALAAVNAALVTGPTGVNHADLILVTAGP